MTVSLFAGVASNQAALYRLRQIEAAVALQTRRHDPPGCRPTRSSCEPAYERLLGLGPAELVAEVRRLVGASR